MPSNLIFMGLHFVIGKRMFSAFNSKMSILTPYSLRQFFARHVSSLNPSINFRWNGTFSKLYIFIFRLNTRKITREKIARARSTGSGEPGVHVVDPRRIRTQDSDELAVRIWGSPYLTVYNLQLTILNSSVYVQSRKLRLVLSLGKPCLDSFPLIYIFSLFSWKSMSSEVSNMVDGGSKNNYSPWAAVLM